MRHVAIALALGLLATPLAHGQCPGDVVPNGVVNGTDLAEVLGSWGPCSSCAADTNGDGQVNGVDLAGVLGGWGPCRPIITSISPNQGHVNGGGQITISGHYLGGTTSVTVGGNPASNVTVVSSNTVRVVTPAGSLGTVDVVAVGATESVTMTGGFTYVPILVPAWATLVDAIPDPSIVHNATLREAIVATTYAWRVRDTATQIEFVLIPPGTFQMGCSVSNWWPCYSNENPVHQVTLTQPFYMGRYEVTQAQWQATMGWNPSHFSSPSSEVPADQVPNRPAERVSWIAIQSFLSATGARLPTEAEWEWAYRAGTITAYHSMPGYPNGTNDDSLAGTIGWNLYDPSNSQTRPVGQKASNGFGLHDMAGNVWEWVNDWFSYYPSTNQTDPTGPMTGAARVFRGGALRCSPRGSHSPEVTEDAGVGFRVARNP